MTAICHLIMVSSEYFLHHLLWLTLDRKLVFLILSRTQLIRVLPRCTIIRVLPRGAIVQLCLLLGNFLILNSLFVINNILDGSGTLKLWLRRLIWNIFLLRNDSLHMAELFLKSRQHLFGNLKLNSSGMMLYCEGIWAEILDQSLIKSVIIALTHLQDHIFVTSQFLSICDRGWQEAFWCACEISDLRIGGRWQKI